MKKKKQQQNNQLVRSQLSEIFNSKYQEFKKKLQEYHEDQLASIELVLQLRVAEIVDIQNQVKGYLQKINNQQLSLKDQLDQLESRYIDAVSFLENQEETQIEDYKKKYEEELKERVENYKDSIDIQ